jgi:arylformamidase
VREGDAGRLRAVELSHSLIPHREELQLNVVQRFIDDVLPQYPRPSTEWHIVSEVSFISHVGTHIEAPLHYLEGGADTASLPLSALVGECALVHFTDKAVEAAIDADEVAERGSHIRERDVVFVHTGRGNAYRTPQAHDRPFLTQDAVRWLVEKKIACLGVDCSGIERRGQPYQPNHAMLFSHGIPLIEHLVNLEKLSSDRFFVVAVPLRVAGLDASPVAVVGLESVAGGASGVDRATA